MVQVECKHCMGGRAAPCPKCNGKGYRWIPHGMTESDYDAALAGDGDSLESIIDGLTVDRPGGLQ